MMHKEIIQKENFYGHLKRLRWIQSHTRKGERILEVGCGAGTFITTPLILSGRDAYGVDIGAASIKEAQRIARENGINAQRYSCKDISEVDGQYDVVICSEVLEHITDDEQNNFVKQLCNHVCAGGKLIITVPNGKGTYELGQKYFKDPVEKLLHFMQPFFRFMSLIHDVLCNLFLKNKVVSNSIHHQEVHLTFTDTPHVQWFSVEDILELFLNQGFSLVEFTGSAMFSGICINTFLKPRKSLCNVNNKLGEMFPRKASGFYFCFKKGV